MSNSIDYYKKLEKIKSDHRMLLEMVRDRLSENGQALGSDIHAVFNCIKYDENQTAKYKALLDAKYTIENLINMILEATTYEEVVKIRERLNYYINKIKKEMVSRNLGDEMIAHYQNQASYLRKDIAKSIRVLKRENNIDTIEGLVMLSEVVVSDGDESLKKMIKNEMRFNDYYLKPKKVSIISEEKVNKPSEDKPKTDEQQTVVQKIDYSNLFKELDEAFSAIEVTNENKPEADDIENAFKPLFSGKEMPNDTSNSQSEFVDDKKDKKEAKHGYFSERDYLFYMAKRYTQQYHIKNPKRYGHSRGKNIVKFFGNIPTYIYNKQAVNEMQYDSSIFYGGSDFISFIEYTRRRNSIRNALKSVFSRSYLTTFEGQCLNNHECCVKWMQSYCKENRLEMDYLGQRVLTRP